MTKQELKDKLQSVMMDKCNFSYKSNVTQLDVGEWGFETTTTSKAYQYNNREIAIVAKFESIESYDDLINNTFYGIIDTSFTDRYDRFDNRTLMMYLTFRVKVGGK